MLFSSDIYNVGHRSSQVFARSEVGRRFAPDWRLYYTGLFANAIDVSHLPRLSPWHAIMTRPYRHENIYNYVNEIPRGAREKIELNKSEPYNPLWQDRKGGGPGAPDKLRSFSYGNCPFNYGFLPRTYEDPAQSDPHLMKADAGNISANGDNDPIDVVELSGASLPVGAASQVRVLGALAMLDEGEADWKILVADVDDPDLTRLSDVPATTIATIVDWFRNYKTTDGKPQNEFAFGAKVLDDAYAMHVIETTQRQYEAVVRGKGGRSSKAPPKGVWVPTAPPSLEQKED